MTGFCVLLVGCASTVKVGRLTAGQPWQETGIPYYLPKPYLLITKNFTPVLPAAVTSSNTPASTPSPKKETSTNDMTESTTGTNVLDKFSYQLIYLPDTNQMYSVKITRGLGSSSNSINLLNGWTLTSINMQNDSKTAELVQGVSGSFKDLVTAATSAGGAIAKFDKLPEILKPILRDVVVLDAGVWLYDINGGTLHRIWPDKPKNTIPSLESDQKPTSESDQKSPGGTK